MKTVLRIIEEAGGFATFTWTRIENPPLMPLVIESLGERGPNGHDALSIAHYGQQNGDAMRDPEICAEIVMENGAAKLWPYYFRNDYAGVERWNRQQQADGSMTCRPRETRDLESFMEMWDANIHEQGFLVAFQDCGAAMLIHGFVSHSRVNGPGVRVVVYFQGCNLGCASCWNPATHTFTGLSHEAQDVAEQAAAAHQFIEGVTLSGGEPMQQALDLLEVIRLLKRARPEISIGMYSGYTERELDRGRFWTQCGIAQEARRRVWADIKQELDFAVLGRFVAARPSKFPMRTSANQVLRLFSDRSREEHSTPLEFEVHIEVQGLTQITGFPLVGLPL